MRSANCLEERLLWGEALFMCRHRYLNVALCLRKPGDADGGSGGPRFLEVRCINRIHALEHIHVGEKDGYGNDIGIAHSGRFQNGSDIVESCLYLALEIVGNLSGFGVRSHLPRYIERSVDKNAWAEQRSRSTGRCTRKSDDFLFGQRGDGGNDAKCKSESITVQVHLVLCLAILPLTIAWRG